MSYDSINQIIKDIHLNDEKQLDIIYNEDNRIIVEAPAGCGKTKTLISKIAYIIATNKLESTKKIMALTFSVNAAYKIKKDVYEQLPKLLECDDSKALELVNRIYVSNYHGFSRRILQKYGKSIVDGDIDFNKLKVFDDTNKDFLIKELSLEIDIATYLSDFSNKIKINDEKYIEENWKTYNTYIKEKIIPKGAITYNSIILLTYELFNNESIKEFYQRYFPIIFIDEFQDTNYIAWMLINKLIGSETKICFLGDPLQRIYGFIGALPDLMDRAEKNLKMKKINLNKNYRFKDNIEMLNLDKNIRLNAIELDNNNIIEDSNPDIILLSNQENEAKWITNKVNELSKNGKVAILVRTGISNKNTLKIKETLENNNVEYFYALFTDEDNDYQNFHVRCLEEFNNLIKNKNVVTYKVLQNLKINIEKIFTGEDSLIKSLIKLLTIFCDNVLDECKHLNQEEKINYIRDTFENNGLRQSLEKLDEKIILATVHACKGLEYKYVIVADNEQNSFPTYMGACKDCYTENKENPKCKKRFSSSNELQYYEELSVFYVALTRAKEKVIFTMSKERLNFKGVSGKTVGSCFLKLKGIGYDNLKNLKDKEIETS